MTTQFHRKPLTIQDLEEDADWHRWATPIITGASAVPDCITSTDLRVALRESIDVLMLRATRPEEFAPQAVFDARRDLRTLAGMLDAYHMPSLLRHTMRRDDNGSALP